MAEVQQRTPELVHFRSDGRDNFMLRVNQQQALALIESVTKQIQSGNSNVGRLEMENLVYSRPTNQQRDGSYFSVAVIPAPEIPFEERVFRVTEFQGDGAISGNYATLLRVLPKRRKFYPREQLEAMRVGQAIGTHVWRGNQKPFTVWRGH
jgi:hypothetical protein